jgi:hypothetical protein
MTGVGSGWGVGVDVGVGARECVSVGVCVAVDGFSVCVTVCGYECSGEAK